MDVVIVRYKLGKRHGRLDLKHKITFITGDSATGKTTLIDDLRNIATTITVSDGFELRPLPMANLDCLEAEYILDFWRSSTNLSKVVFYCDEDEWGLSHREFQEAMLKAPYLFLVMKRTDFGCIPHSVSSICKLCCTCSVSQGNSYYIEPLYD